MRGAVGALNGRSALIQRLKIIAIQAEEIRKIKIREVEQLRLVDTTYLKGFFSS